MIIFSVVFPLNNANTTHQILYPNDIEHHLIKHSSLGKCFEISLDQFQEPLAHVLIYTKLPAYIYTNIAGQFRHSDSYSKVEVKPKHSLFIELSYEVIMQNEDTACKRYLTATYDACCEREAEKEMQKRLNCTVPFTNSPGNLSICTEKDKTSKVNVIIILIINLQARGVIMGLLGMQHSVCPPPCQKMVVSYGFPFIEEFGKFIFLTINQCIAKAASDFNCGIVQRSATKNR